jgi:hypothetical protein
MTVSKITSTSGLFTAHSGTLQEVINSLDASTINNLNNVIIYYNGTNVTAVSVTR